MQDYSDGKKSEPKACTCRPKKGRSDYCSNEIYGDEECKSGICGKAVKTPPLSCKECLKSSDCPSGHWCSESGVNQCKKLKSKKQGCGSGKECSSGKCSFPGFR